MGSDKHIVETTPVSFVRALAGIHRRACLSIKAKSIPTTAERTSCTMAGTRVQHAGEGTSPTPTVLTVVMDQVPIPAELVQHKLMKERLQREYLYDYFVITTSGWLDLPSHLR